MIAQLARRSRLHFHRTSKAAVAQAALEAGATIINDVMAAARTRK